MNDFPISTTLLYDKRWYKTQFYINKQWQFCISKSSWIFFSIHHPECRFIIAKVLMVFDVSPPMADMNRGLLYRLSASRQTGEKGFLRDPHPHKKPGSSACQSIILPARAILLTFWEAVILRSPVDFKLMTFCFPYFQNRHGANLSFPGQWAW